MFVHSFSGVVRVPCALGQKIFLRPLLIKTTKFEVKNSRENLKMQNLFFFESNNPHAVLEKMNLTKL